MRTDDSHQVLYAQDVVAQLWPAEDPPVVVSLPSQARHNDASLEWFLLPNPRRPTLLVPTSVRPASRMLQRHGDGLLPHLIRGGVATAIRSGLLKHLPTPRLRVSAPAESTNGMPRSIVTHIARTLPDLLACGLILGTPRPNRKPVLQLFAADGTTLGFAKIGITPTTRQLVRTEANNLETVNRAHLRGLEVPQILHQSTFNDSDVLVLSPMASSQERRDAPIPLSAMRELAQLSATGPIPFDSSEFWRTMTREVESCADSPGAAQTTRLMARAANRWGSSPVDFGSWHGDWAPWNMGYRDHTVQLWDWERFGSPVPIGFDAIHFAAQHVRHDRNDTARREADLEDQLVTLLTGSGSVAGAQEPQLVLALYLLTLNVRFAHMAAEPPASALHPRARWALGFAERVIAGGDSSAVRVS